MILLATWSLACSLAFAPPAGSAPSSPAASLTDPEFSPASEIRAAAKSPRQSAGPMRTPGYYLHIAPGVLSFDVRGPDLLAYVWGLGGGRFIPRREHLAIAIGGFVEHLIMPVHNVHSVRLHRPRLGAELRVGGSSERVFGYGLARVGLDLLFGEPGGFGEVSGLITVGGGVQGALGPRGRLLLGAEPSFDVTVPSLWRMVRARVFIGVRF